MQFTFENKGTSSYLVYEIQPSDELDTMSVGMLTNNRIDGLAPVSFTQMDSIRKIHYNVTSKISVHQVFEVPVTRQRLLSIFSNIVSAFLSVEDYMIDLNSIVVDPNYIFVDVTTNEVMLICVPVISLTSREVDLQSFFKNLFFSVQYDSRENCAYIAQIINYLNSSMTFSLEEFKNILDTLLYGGGAVGPAEKKEPWDPSKTGTVDLEVYRKIIGGDSIDNRDDPRPPMPPYPQPPYPQPPYPQPPHPQPPHPQPPHPQPPHPQPPHPQPPHPQPPHPQPPHPQPPHPQPPVPQPGPNQKRMSFFHLMMHYSKENAAIYKAQKEQAKQAKYQQYSHVNGQQGNNGQRMNIPGQNPQIPRNGGMYPPPPGGKKQPKGMPGMNIPGQNVQNPQYPPQASPAKGKTKGKKPPMNIPGQTPPGGSLNGQFPQQPGRQEFIPHGPGTTWQPDKPGTPAVPGDKPWQEEYYPQVQVQGMNPNASGNKPDFGQTVILNPKAGQTVVLNAAVAPSQPYLLRCKTGEKIPLNKPVFRIGKEKSYVDYCIADNKAISRSHANVIFKNGKYYVVDTNSTNHTYVNGKILPSNMEMEIAHGMKIRLADEEFEFHLY